MRSRVGKAPLEPGALASCKRITLHEGRTMQVIHPVCCGIDAHSAQLTACLRRASEDGEITTELVEYGTPLP